MCVCSSLFLLRDQEIVYMSIKLLNGVCNLSSSIFSYLFDCIKSNTKNNWWWLLLINYNPQFFFILVLFTRSSNYNLLDLSTWSVKFLSLSFLIYFYFSCHLTYSSCLLIIFYLNYLIGKIIDFYQTFILIGTSFISNFYRFSSRFQSFRVACVTFFRAHTQPQII